jgi:hypothetical protein
MALGLDEKVVALTRRLDADGIPHAFGGALALAYYAEPRATIDIDVNVFAAPRRATATLEALTSLGADADRRRTMQAIRETGQARVRWDRTPIDLFFSYDPFHTACASARRQVPFGDARIPILAPEHLTVCKAVYDRRKDWIDIEQILLATARELDTAEMLGWVRRIAGAGDRRTVRLERLVGRIVAPRAGPATRPAPAPARTPRRSGGRSAPAPRGRGPTS